MATLLLSLVIITLSIAGLAVGVLMGREPIKGSCGGLACENGGACAACGGKRQQSVERTG